MNFEAYLASKKIDSAAFQRAEPVMWGQWQVQFEQMHPNSFTVQKLNLINPIRRKYQLKEELVKPEPRPPAAKPPAADRSLAATSAGDAVTPAPDAAETPATTPRPKPAVPRPVFKSKPPAAPTPAPDEPLTVAPAADSVTPAPDAATPEATETAAATSRPKPAVPRPVFKPKPKPTNDAN